jgi:predicted MPP superfamily phosphohydrolase
MNNPQPPNVLPAQQPVAEQPVSNDFTPFRLRLFWRLLATIQAILFLAHWFLYETWLAFHPSLGPATHDILRIVFFLASVSFVIASLLAWRYFNGLVRAFYVPAAVWIGFMSFSIFAACSSWIVLGLTRLANLQIPPNRIADGLFGAAFAIAFYGLVNAARVRVHRITVRLPNLPAHWHGRVAALVSDLHLGHVRNIRFLRRIVAKLNSLRPDLVFITGDMYDGTAVDAGALAQPWSALLAPLGAFFITGNHEEFTSREKYLQAVASAGVRVLNNEKLELDGLQIVGVHWRETTDPELFRSILRNAAIQSTKASVLLVHAPHQLAIAEEEGISLQVCGHTHGGQFPPGSWVASRVYGAYVHGLNRFGRLLVFTSWGVGTWGPPLRVGTQPEIVLITCEAS